MNFTTPLREITCHVGSHSVTCHPAAWLLAFTPAKAGTRFSDPGGMQGWVQCVCMWQTSGGPRVCNGSIDDTSVNSTLSSSSDCIQLAACEAGELLPMNPELPADIFTSCLTTPIKVALRWSVTAMLLFCFAAVHLPLTCYHRFIISIIL